MTEQITEQMAIEHIGNLAGDYKCWDDRISREESLILCKLLDELEQYRALGTVEELRVARDKQVDKKVVFVHPLQLDDGGDYMCPSCKTGTVYDAYGQQSNHCPYCGQKLNWEEGVKMIFEKIRERLRKWDKYSQDGLISVMGVMNIINQVEAEYNNGWIPCSERLPDVEADVLLSLRSLDIYTGFRANTEGCFYVEGEGYVEYDNVLAWQPLPKPFIDNK